MMDSPRSPWIVAALLDRSGEGGQALETAAALVSMWTDISSALQSIVGRQGVAALYDRTVSLTALQHSWIASARAGTNAETNLAALRTAVAEQSARRAAAGGALFLQQFYDLLVSLIGASLSDQLLAPVRENRPNSPTQDA